MFSVQNLRFPKGDLYFWWGWVGWGGWGGVGWGRGRGWWVGPRDPDPRGGPHGPRGIPTRAEGPWAPRDPDPRKKSRVGSIPSWPESARRPPKSTLQCRIPTPAETRGSEIPFPGRCPPNPGPQGIRPTPAKNRGSGKSRPGQNFPDRPAQGLGRAWGWEGPWAQVDPGPKWAQVLLSS